MIYEINGNVTRAYDINGNPLYDDTAVSVGYVYSPEYITKNGNNYRLVWHDEFDEKDLDRNFWMDQYFISNVENRYQAQSDYYLADGILNLRVKKDMPPRYPNGTGNPTAQSSIQTGEYNGTYVATEQYHDVNPFWGLLAQEGYFEMRLKPWSAVSGCCNVWWMMGIQDAIHQKAQMDGQGEIDVIEFLQKNPTVYPHGQHPNADNQITEVYHNTDVGVNLTNDFHVIGFLWEPGSYRWYLDGNLIDTVSGITTLTYPAYQLLSAYKVISGTGDWKGDVDPTLNSRDVEFKIDYFRIYKKASMVSTDDVTVSNYNPITINGNTADMEIDPDRGCPYQFPSFVYVNWSDGTRTEHWVKWDAVRDTYRTKMTNHQSFEWAGYVYGLGIDVVANVNYS